MSKCHFCGKVGKDLSRCSRCQNACYCSKECQKADWSSHKNNCVKSSQDERDEKGIRKEIPVSYKIIAPKIEGILKNHDIKGIDLIKKEMSNNDPSMIPLIVKLPFDTKMIENDEDIALDFLEDVLALLYSRSDEELYPYESELYDFMRKMMICQYSQEYNNFCEYLFENMIVVMTEFKKQGLRSDTITKLLMQYWRRETEVVGKINCLHTMSLASPEEMLPYCMALVADTLRDPIQETPVLIAEIIRFLSDHGGKDFVDLIKSCFEKNAVSMGDIGGYATILKKLKLPVDEKDMIVEKYKKWDH